MSTVRTFTKVRRAKPTQEVSVDRPEEVEVGEPVRERDVAGRGDSGADPTPILVASEPPHAGKRGRYYSSDSDEAFRLVQTHKTASIDLETRGLHPHQKANAAIGAIIFRTGGQNFIFREFPSWWKGYLEDASQKKILHNAKFDLMWMIWAFDKDLPFARNIQDTLLKCQLVAQYRTKLGAIKAGFPGKWEPNDLKSALKRFLGVDIGKEIDHETTDWAGPWSDEMIEYMLEDIEFLEPLNDFLDDLLVEMGQDRAAWIENSTVFGYAWMTLNGITPDKDSWELAIVEWKEKRDHLRWHLRKFFPEVNNFDSPAQLLPALSRLIGVKVANTRKATLKQLAIYYPEVACLQEYRLYATRLKNWGGSVFNAKGALKRLGFLESYICPECGRFHPSWNQIGTETARTSCSKPNLQQIPRAPEFRKLFVARPGSVLASLDYSAIEILVAAVFANEKNLIAACATGDPHRATAEMIVGHPVQKSDPARQMAKIANFGLLFLGGRDGLIEQARDLFDTILTVGQAEIIMKQYFKLYPGLKKTKKWAYDEIRSEKKIIEVVNGVGFIRYLEGYNRKPTTMANTWIQSTAGHGLKSSFTYLMESGLLPFLCMQVHDELVFEFDEEDADEFVPIAKSCMIRGMHDVLGQVPVKVDDTAVGKVWL